MIKQCKNCGNMPLSQSYKNFDLVNDLQWLKQLSKVKSEKPVVKEEDKKIVSD